MLSTELREGELSDACGWACAIEPTGMVVAKPAASVPSRGGSAVVVSRAGRANSQATSEGRGLAFQSILAAPSPSGRNPNGPAGVACLVHAASLRGTR
jgi:hypothetical protein